MFDKLLAIQQKAGEIKKRLDTISVQAEAEGGKIRVSATANKHITAITLDADFLKSADKEELEELIATSVNKALQEADRAAQAEMDATTQNMMGGLGSIFGK